ncbi:oxygen-dependent coproporphyrinogen-III oxidase, mitochondrial isoform X3 [Anopheles aquasalis]|uniref:oxygen-dependent coproporphyrinogen-III oxidase, mitochondrial isoform X3 n=1 Tax=Anopheles aquasalis TaxID=42839 RepID=UPI00215A5F6A|nr:oxygen-dependent coproporphyrinogen-III oxidase, mitochondrial isoform X3 [Anopheles aquasalis]
MFCQLLRKNCNRLLVRKLHSRNGSNSGRPTWSCSVIRLLGGSICAGGIGLIAYYKLDNNNVHMAGSSLNKFSYVSQYMAEPITDRSILNTHRNEMKYRMEELVMKIQHDFCRALEAEESFGKQFVVDRWERKEGGGGITCVLQDGDIFEKAGFDGIRMTHMEINKGSGSFCAVVDM